MEIRLKEFERIDDLQFKGLRIIQNTKKFCFGTDAVLLSHFAGIRKKDKVVDLGTGTGIIPILLAGREQDACFYGVEIQSDMVEMANRSVRLNNLESRMRILKADLKEAPEILGKGRFTLVVSNPPYKKANSGIRNSQENKAIARHEILCVLEDILASASKLLCTGGRFAMVHRPDRMMDILMGMRQYRLEPKRIRMVHPQAHKAPILVLIEGVLNGKPYLNWMPPLIVYDQNMQYTNELKEIYHLR
ncbi:MAG: tRNA1(Val) (adenine(37)-N6)-methyltransferase [Caldicoprobacterales bacterium]|jgi:tRNA1Val (adenine37-N6)-methyltransferase|nr:tRNA1(Val) (adenine(37)-N6)-methyltransferase [Clostridiales bacterium]